jgi:hypothetical protein
MGKTGKSTAHSNMNRELEMLAKQNELTSQERLLGFLYSVWLATLPCYLYWKLKMMSPFQLLYIPSTIVQLVIQFVQIPSIQKLFSSAIYPLNALLFLVTIAFSSTLLYLAFQQIFVGKFKEMDRYRTETVADVLRSSSSASAKKSDTSLMFFSSPIRAAAHMNALLWLGISYTLLFLMCYGIIFIHFSPI